MMMPEVFADWKVFDCWEVDGYRSSSGEVSSFRFRLLPPEGYRDLVRMSLELLPEAADAVEWLRRMNVEVEIGQMAPALRALRESFTKTLAKPFDPAEVPQDRVVQTQWGVEIFGVEVTPAPPVKKAVKPETVAKNAIRAVLPVAKYVHVLVFGRETGANYDAVRKLS